MDHFYAFICENWWRLDFIVIVLNSSSHSLWEGSNSKRFKILMIWVPELLGEEADHFLENSKAHVAPVGRIKINKAMTTH